MLRRIALIALLAIASSAVLAQYDNQRNERSPSDSRSGRFETSVILAYQNGTDETYEGDAALNIDSKIGWGLSFGWNWTEKLNLSYKLAVTKPDYLATIVPEDAELSPQFGNFTMTKYAHQFNLTYNFSKKAFTPFVLAGVGWTRLDSKITTGPLQTACWWDPWWGYICPSDWDTYTASKFAYNLGLGVRWDINNAIFTKAAYSREFLSLKNGTLNFDMAILEIGLMF
jgi:opacity protein-like surface antigen